MTETRAEQRPESAIPPAGAGQPIPEYLLRSLPELRVLPDWAAYLAWREVCGKRTQRSYGWYVLWLMAVGALSGTLGGFGGPLLARQLARVGITGVAGVGTASGLASLVAVCTVGFSVAWAIRGRTQRRVREGLIAIGYPVCLQCGYDLRGSAERRCSECGTPFDPADRERILAKIAAGRPKSRGGWIAWMLVVVLGVAAGAIFWRMSVAAAAKRAAATRTPLNPTPAGGR